MNQARDGDIYTTAGLIHMAYSEQSTGHYAEEREISEQLARRTLRASLATDRGRAFLAITVGLTGSWMIVFFAGGVNEMVPHWYYVPILFAAVRFGHMAALIVAIVAGIMAGPLTYADVTSAAPQDWSRWTSRTAFFIGIGQLMAWMVKPSLRPIGKEVRLMRDEFAIRRALTNGEFFLRYQPIFSLKHDTFIGAEALIRWQHPARGELPPAEFVEVAEQSSLISDLSNFVIEEACRQAAEWRQLALLQNRPAWHVAINLSARDLERTDLSQTISQALARHNLPAEFLHVELTEGLLLYEGADFQLRQLKRLGIKLVVDDFGTGYSSLSYLHRFPVDALKIDRSLISDLTPEKHGRSLANGIVLLAKSIGLRTIAEGLETIGQLRAGKTLGFDFVQGYYLAKPLKAGEIPSLILAGGGVPQTTSDSEPHDQAPVNQ